MTRRIACLSVLLVLACEGTGERPPIARQPESSSVAVGRPESVKLTDGAIAAAAETPVDPFVTEDDYCGFVKKNAHPDPVTLVRNHVARDARGELRSSGPLINEAVDCPWHLGGPDTYALIAGYTIELATIGDTLAIVPVTFRRIGWVEAYSSQLHVDTATIVMEVFLWKSAYGWRMRKWSFPWLNIDVEHANALPAATRRTAEEWAAELLSNGA